MTDLLELSLLGGVTLKLGGNPLTGLASRRTEALLIYLVCTGQPQTREALATLLWDERSQSRALGNLRVLLTSLRQTLGPYVTITRQAVAFNRNSPHRLDVAELEKGLAAVRLQRSRNALLSSPDVVRLARTVDLYQGDFLEGFYLPASRDFEEWQAAQRERLRLQVIEGLQELVTGYLALADYPAGLEQARRLLQLDPLSETAHRQLMQLLACSGQRNAALTQYQTCCQILADALGVEPMPETTAFYEQIRDGQVGPPPRGPGSAFQSGPVSTSAPPPLPAPDPGFFSLPTPSPPFVTRDYQLAQLSAFLGQALLGQGQVVFVTGGAGSGKTTLVQEFTRRAQDVHANLIVAGGHCNAQTGLGDPYLPLAETLGLLTGDIEAKWAEGIITRENAGRLWALGPDSIPLLAELGPDLIDSFVSGSALLSQLAVFAASPATRAAEGVAGNSRINCRARLEQLVSRNLSGQEMAKFQQRNLFEQYISVLHALSERRPLLLVLDDLHWAAPSSISLLFHLGRHIRSSRILLIGAYRPEDIAVDWPNTAHPLEEVVYEFKRERGDITLDLDLAIEAEGRHFVDTLLDTEPNRLDATFRQVLFQHTDGHPLFTVELLRDMQDRGDMQRNSAGQWVAGSTLNWQTLPARVEGVIQKRIGRLPVELRQALRIASVEGETFTAEVVARVQGIDEQDLIQRLSAELVRQHRLLRRPSVEWVGSQPLSRYRFRHHLFQHYLYHTLDEVECMFLHQAVGRTLEVLYGEQGEQAAVQLARHFQAAGNIDKAIDYFLHAGSRACRLSAYEEAIEHLQQGLALLNTLPNTPERAQRQQALQLPLTTALNASKS